MWGGQRESHQKIYEIRGKANIYRQILDPEPTNATIGINNLHFVTIQVGGNPNRESLIKSRFWIILRNNLDIFRSANQQKINRHLPPS